MKKVMIICVVLLGSIFASAVAQAEETGCFLPKDNWIVRVYATGNGPFSVMLAVLDTSGVLVPASGIAAFSGGANQCANPCLFENSAVNEDVSLACDSGSGTAFILHDRAGQLHLTSIEGIVSVQTGSPVLQVSATVINFGTVAVGSSKGSTVTVSNTGNANLSVASVSAPAAPFSKTGDTCSGGTLAPGGACAVTITFSPAAATTSTGSFIITSNGGNAAVQLQGTGTAASQPPVKW